MIDVWWQICKIELVCSHQLGGGGHVHLHKHCLALLSIAWHRPPRIVILSSKLDYLKPYLVIHSAKDYSVIEFISFKISRNPLHQALYFGYSVVSLLHVLIP